MLKVGIVGCGNIFTMHATSAHHLPNAEIVAVCDIKKDRADKAAAKYNCKPFYDYKEMISLNKFTTAQIDKNTWTKEMLDLLMKFIEKDDRAAEYRGLDWSEEYDLAINGDPNDTQSAL